MTSDDDNYRRIASEVNEILGMVSRAADRRRIEVKLVTRLLSEEFR